MSGSSEEKRSNVNWAQVIGATAGLMAAIGALIGGLAAAGVIGGGDGHTVTPLVVGSSSTTPATPTSRPTSDRINCAPSYPGVCIRPPPPNLSCGQISERNFRVVYDVPDPDPHGFDRDHDGTGCES
jgi:hypothetical protein